MSDRDDASIRPGWHPETLGDARLAGDAPAQNAFRRRAGAALESYQTPAGGVGTRISNAWLGERGWRVQPVGHYLVWKEEWMALLTSFVNRNRRRALLGGFFGADQAVSPIWKIPANPDGTSRFFEAHQFGFHMLFPDDLSFLLHANEGDFVVYAGSPDFIHAALPAEGVGRAATDTLKLALEREHGTGWFNGILDHYAPFLLDE